MARKYISIFFVISMLSACSKKNKGTLIVTDVSRDTTFIINTNTTLITSLKLYITGETNDSIMVNSIGIRGGEIKEALNLDWYSSTVNIFYKAYKAKAGHIEIDYYVP